MTRPTRKFKRMAEVYKVFCSDWIDCLDFSDQALKELFIAESLGGQVASNNGYAEGKKFLNVNVSMWKEDIEKGNLFIHELYCDDKLPNWWLDKVFKGHHLYRENLIVRG